MKVNFYATLRGIVGKKTVAVDLNPGATAQDVVNAVTREYPALKEELLDENGQFRSQMKFFINGREVIYLEDQMDTVIRPDDKVDIFPQVGGG